MGGAQEHTVRSFDFNQEKIHSGQPRTILPSRFGGYRVTLGGQLNRKCAEQLCQQPAGKGCIGNLY